MILGVGRRWYIPSGCMIFGRRYSLEKRQLLRHCVCIYIGWSSLAIHLEEKDGKSLA